MNFSFNSIKDTIINRLPENVNILVDSVFGVVIDVIAYVLSLFAYYVEYLFKESFWKHAKSRETLVSQSYMLSYTPHRKIGASGRVIISADKSFSTGGLTYTGGDVFLKRWDQLTDESGSYSCYVTEDVYYPDEMFIRYTILNPGSSVLPLSQGRVRFSSTNHFFSNGSLITIKGTRYYDGDYIIVNVPSPNEFDIIATYTPENNFSGTEEVYTGHKSVNIKEGTPKTYKHIGEGTVNERITIIGDNIDNDEIEVFIVDSNDNVIEEVEITDRPYFVNDIINYYCTVENIPNFTGIVIQFGDEKYYKQLEKDAIVLVKYAETKGAQGNISSSNYITKFKEPVYNINGELANIYVKNDAEISDGKDYEDIEDIREKGRYLFYTGYRASTKEDWKTIIESHPSVKQAIVWTDEDIDNYYSGINTNIYVTAVTVDGSPLTPIQKTDLSLNYLKDKKSITDITNWQELKIVSCRFEIDATIKLVPESTVKKSIYETLANNYSILNTDFAKSLYSSNVDKIIDLLDDVYYHYTKIKIVERSDIYETIKAQTSHQSVVSFTADQTNVTDNQVYILEGTTEIFIKRKIGGQWENEIKVGECDTIDNTKLVGMNTTQSIDIGVGDNSKTTFNIPESNLVPIAPHSVSILLNGQEAGTDNGEGIITGTTIDSSKSNINYASGEMNIEFITPPTSSDTIQVSYIKGYTLTTGSHVNHATNTFNFTIDNIFYDPDTFGVINPEAYEDLGYTIHIVYQTRNGDATSPKFINDIRLPYFYNITDVAEEDIITTFSYN